MLLLHEAVRALLSSRVPLCMAHQTGWLVVLVNSCPPVLHIALAASPFMKTLEINSDNLKFGALFIARLAGEDEFEAGRVRRRREHPRLQFQAVGQFLCLPCLSMIKRILDLANIGLLRIMNSNENVALVTKLVLVRPLGTL